MTAYLWPILIYIQISGYLYRFTNADAFIYFTILMLGVVSFLFGMIKQQERNGNK